MVISFVKALLFQTSSGIIIIRMAQQDVPAWDQRQMPITAVTILLFMPTPS